jgi:hypothetical protein
MSSARPRLRSGLFVGYLPCIQQRKTNIKSHFAGLAPPSRYFLLLRQQESTQRKGDPQRVEFPPQPHRTGRGRNLRRANVAPAADSRPLNTLSGTPVSACADGSGAASGGLLLRRPVPIAALVLLCDQVARDAVYLSKITIVSTPPLAPSSMPTGGAAAVLSGWLFERLDVSQSRVPAVPQQCQVPEGSRRSCLPGWPGR